MNLSSEQEAAIKAAVNFVKDRSSFKEFFVIGGLAGTGKTTILKEVSERLKADGKIVKVIAPTGKAAQVLTKKGVPATSVHRLVYEIVSMVPLIFERTQKVECDVIIVDEASMVNEEMFEDILFFGKKVIFVGDYGQLPPIGGDPKIMGLMDVKLEQVFRQQEGGGILALAEHVRMFPDSPVRQFIPSIGDGSIKLAPTGSMMNKDYLSSFDQIIVGKNVTRRMLNAKLCKSSLGPVAGDKVICLKNNYEFGVINGEQFIIADIIDPSEENEWTPMIRLLKEDGEHITVPYWRDFFFDANLGVRNHPRKLVWLDYAYAITCHKSQGSEWDKVLVINEAFGDEKQRWLYTAVTRAKKELHWI